MTSIYMIKKEILFNGFQPTPGSINKMVAQDSLYFPTNVKGCGISIAQNSFICFGHSTEPDITAQVHCNVQTLGVGIENISYNGTQVIFSAWMQLLGIKVVDDAETEEWTCLNPHTSYITIEAIAECE